MMTHYLHTSRKADCPVTPSQHGQVGGNYYSNKGGGSNYLCLPNDPENGNVSSNGYDGLYGAEYQIDSSNNPSRRKSCYKGWKSEYNGFLMSSHKTHITSDFICMDGEAEPLNNSSSNEQGALFYPVRAKCGSLRCPPYKDKTEVLCTVCTK
ncbi:unnamed protein product [Mytilus edulis]|uniref:Uncharacterized protein n=1 Tax=Mytilus edulis TaxID=6550 RepID=A0A8S3UC06_MYTED|nr:unnamed protein product [Mytilus edulis]